jgi:uncharacterized protein (DUF2147 family)
VIASLLFFLLAASPASTLTGNWTTPAKDVVQVYACGDNQLCVRVAMVGQKDAPTTDVNNPDASLRKRALCGLTIGTGFAPNGDASAKDGKIYDPESGKTYSAQMQANGDVLRLRGYIGVSLLGRTETWHRMNGAVTECR